VSGGGGGLEVLDGSGEGVLEDAPLLTAASSSGGSGVAEGGGGQRRGRGRGRCRRTDAGEEQTGVPGALGEGAVQGTDGGRHAEDGGEHNYSTSNHSADVIGIN